MHKTTEFYTINDPNKTKYVISTVSLMPGIITYIILENTKAVSTPIIYVVVVVFLSVLVLYLFLGYSEKYIFRLDEKVEMLVIKGFLWQKKKVEEISLEKRVYIFRSYEDSLFEVVLVKKEDKSGVNILTGTSRGVEKKTVEIEMKLKSIGMQILETNESLSATRFVRA